MDKILIKGGKPLLGTVEISGAKNAALPALAATLLTSDAVVLQNVPCVRDIQTTGQMLRDLGVRPTLGLLSPPIPAVYLQIT
jgi:UDP-N-acetylglucosamine 1-carboxyvinyltransferase